MRKFLNFVEIQTKLATIIPFLAALAYVFHNTGTINIFSTLIYIPAALLWDMSVTAINNHINMAEDGTELYYERLTSLAIIGVMMLISAGFGLCLAYLHGSVVLIAGAFCFLMGILYSFGPAPICKSSYGELVSGFVVGTVIMFIVVSINDPGFQPIVMTFDYQNMFMFMDIDILGLLSFGLITLPAALCISNILLANNICDAEADRPYRYTLVHSIGQKKALLLFASLYAAAYLAIAAASLLRLIPIWCLLTLITIIPVQKNIRKFFEKQVKSQTFILSVKNFTIIMMAYTLFIFFGGLFR